VLFRARERKPGPRPCLPRRNAPADARGAEARACSRGFTLLEIIVTLCILTVLVGAVSPVFVMSLRHNRQDQAIRDFVAYLKFAQECSIAEGVEYRVYLNEEERTFWVMHYTPDKDGRLFLVEAAQPYAGMRRFPEEVEVDDVKARDDREREAVFISFYPNGACDYASVKLRYGRHGRFKIETEGNLGVFEIKEKGE
jgi:prepilin-type N-terminal cleavage/methylation domain-containing protein